MPLINQCQKMRSLLSRSLLECRKMIEPYNANCTYRSYFNSVENKPVLKVFKDKSSCMKQPLTTIRKFFNLSNEKKEQDDKNTELATVPCDSISKAIEDIIASKNSLKTIPSTKYAIVGGKKTVYDMWLTRNFAYSPQKMNILAKLIKNKSLEDAKTQLKFSKKKYGLNLHNAILRIEKYIREDLKLDPIHFFLKEVIVCKGKKLVIKYPMQPRIPVKIVLRTSLVCMKIERYDVECSEEDKVALSLKSLMKIKPELFSYKKSFYKDMARNPKLMAEPPGSMCPAEPTIRYSGPMNSKKKYQAFVPTNQKVYRLPVKFLSSAHTLRNTVGASKRYFKMRKLSAYLINTKKSMKRYRRKKRTTKLFT